MRCGGSLPGSPRAAGGQTKRWTAYEISWSVQTEGETGPFTGPRSGRVALESGKSRYVLACKAVYTGSVPVDASGSGNRYPPARMKPDLLAAWGFADQAGSETGAADPPGIYSQEGEL